MAVVRPVLYLLAFSVIFEAISCLKENDKVILSHMQDWGKAIFGHLTGKTKPHDKGQYLVAAVLSDDDLKTPHMMPARLLKGCPSGGPNKETQMIMCSTSGVFLNRKSKEIWRKSDWKNDQKCGEHAWHGEYILLREGFVKELVENFKGNSCQVYLYSFYIPCAEITNCPYSCSEEIRKYNNKGNTSCKITVIGYTEVFRRPESKTNETSAKYHIKSAQAQWFQNVRKFKLIAIKDVKNRNRMVPFQELMFLCLNESPLSGCCISSAGTLSSGSERIIAFYVNYIVYQAINSLDFNHKKKRNIFVTYSKSFDNLINLIKTTISNGCSVCPHQLYNYLVAKFCVKTAFELASGFGAPSDKWNMSLSSWNFTSKSLKNHYHVPTKEFFKETRLFCAVRTMSVESMCTNFTRPYNKEKRNRDQD